MPPAHAAELSVIARGGESSPRRACLVIARLVIASRDSVAFSTMAVVQCCGQFRESGRFDNVRSLRSFVASPCSTTRPLLPDSVLLSEVKLAATWCSCGPGRTLSPLVLSLCTVRAYNAVTGRCQIPCVPAGHTPNNQPLKPTCYWCDYSTVREDGKIGGGSNVPRSGPHAA